MSIFCTPIWAMRSLLPLAAYAWPENEHTGPQFLTMDERMRLQFIWRDARRNKVLCNGTTVARKGNEIFTWEGSDGFRFECRALSAASGLFSVTELFCWVCFTSHATPLYLCDITLWHWRSVKHNKDEYRPQCQDAYFWTNTSGQKRHAFSGSVKFTVITGIF